MSNETKPITSSYTQITTYTSCPKHWYLKYKLKYEDDSQKASLFYGNAVEAGVLALLENKPHYLREANDNWISQTKWGKTTKIFDNNDIAYAHSDFDEHVLKKEDLETLIKWATELKLDSLGGNPINPVLIYKEVSKLKKNPYKRFSEQHLTYFNRASWLSMLRKAEILIEAFKSQFLPKIKKVHAIQKDGEIVSSCGTKKIKGYIDLILEIEGYDKPVIFDLKTSAGAYSQDKMDLSEQLLVYLAMEGLNYNTNLVGYIVLNKNITKDTVGICNRCAKVKEGRHKTCDNIIEGKRCGGHWHETIKLRPEVQVMVSAKDDFKVDSLLEDYSNVLKAIGSEIVYKNLDRCSSWFGSKCPYYEICNNNDYSKVRKRQ